VLGQVRGLRRAADETPVDPRVVGLLDAAIRVGRRARAERARPERSLADRGLAWLTRRHGPLGGSRLLVAGTGPIGAELARLGRAAGAEVVVASRRPGPGRISLGEGARLVGDVNAVAVALAGRWTALAGLDADVEVGPLVDLSSPPAVPPAVRLRLGDRLATLDRLATEPGADVAAVDAFVAHAERLVADTTVELERSRATRDAQRVSRAIRDTAEVRRAAAMARLERRLPDLTPRELELVEQLSRQLVAGVLHDPIAGLRDDPVLAGAAGALFGVDEERPAGIPRRTAR
jgi:glutamyl-tRNA reductase